MGYKPYIRVLDVNMKSLETHKIDVQLNWRNFNNDHYWRKNKWYNPKRKKGD